jgi:formamidopyrimidine-DNA glycosylase
MPELPDVEVFRRYFQSTALHQRIESVEVRDETLLQDISAKRLESALRGARFTDTRRRGKYLFCGTDAGNWLVLHFGMSGFLKYGKEPESEAPHSRLLLRFNNGFALAYDNQRKLGRIFLAEDVESFIADRDLGPDAWDPPLSREDLDCTFEGRRAAVKSVLMDQSSIAGLGNEYADEVLFQAGIDPRRKAGELDANALAAIHGKIRHVLGEAIERQVDPDRFPDSWLLPRRAKGETCPRCGRKLSHIRIGGRHTVFCPVCQNGA